MDVKSDDKDNKSEKNVKKDNGRRTEREVEELKDKYLRLYAEFDNYKKWVSKEKERFKVMGAVEVLKRVLEIVDAIEGAENMCNETGYNKNEGMEESKKKMQEGIRLIAKKTRAILKEIGVREIACKGNKIDPTVCEAVGKEKSDKEQDVIIKVLRKGYTYKDILIRPALVVVSEGNGRR